MKPARDLAMAAAPCCAPLGWGASPAAAPSDPAAPPSAAPVALDDLFDDFLAAYNGRSFEALRTPYETRFTTAALEGRFSGPAGAARERLRLYHHDGPLERAVVDSAGPGRVFWTRGTVSGGWLGFEWVRTESSLFHSSVAAPCPHLFSAGVRADPRLCRLCHAP